MGEKRAGKGLVALLSAVESRVERVRNALGDEFSLSQAPSGADLQALGDTGPVDLIIVDAASADHVLACRAAKFCDRLERVPLLVLSDDADVRLDALTLGALDSMPTDVDSRTLRRKARQLIRWKIAEDDLRMSERRALERTRELESVIEMVAHDLKSPVAAVGGLIKLLERRISSTAIDAPTQEILTNIIRSCDTIQAFLSDLCESLFVERLDLECDVFTLDQTVMEVVRQYKHTLSEKKIRLRVEPARDLVPVVGDRRRVAQVLNNLLNNAIRHMGVARDPAILIQLETRRDSMVTRIIDNGVGVPAEFRQSVFDKFFRVPNRAGTDGTGLGLAISKAIIERHGGEIWCEPGKERGAAFCFALPRSVRTAVSASMGDGEG